MINIAIINPQPIFRKGLIVLLQKRIHDLQIAASTSGIRDLIHKHRNQVVDVIIWSIPGHHSLTPGARLLKECFPLAKLLVMVPSRNLVYAGLLETLGADSVISDDCKVSELSQAIVTIHEIYVPPPSSNHVQEPMTNPAKPGSMARKARKLYRQGLSYTEIAEKLGVLETEAKNFLLGVDKSTNSEQKAKVVKRKSDNTGHELL